MPVVNVFKNCGGVANFKQFFYLLKDAFAITGVLKNQSQKMLLINPLCKISIIQ